MKRSNRLVLLIGIFLALVAFVLVLLTLGGGGTGTGPTPPPTTVNVVIAANDIALGAKILDTDVKLQQIAIADKPADSFTQTSFVVGQIARAEVTEGQLITNAIINGTSFIKNIAVPPGYVAIAVQVDQVTGVGTIIKAGDYVDMITGITGAEKVPLVEFVTPAPRQSAVPGLIDTGIKYNPTTVKTVVQGIQVLGTLLPPPTQQAAAAQGATPAPNAGATTLNGQQEMVILAVTVQQAEVIKFSQMQGDISLVLRSSSDCKPPAASPSESPSPSGSPAPLPTAQLACPILTTTGITLRRMVDDFGVLPPAFVEIIEPTPYPRP